MKMASNLLLVQNGLALSVSRRDDSTKWGLPGGKVDSGETSLKAAIREMFEEAGLVMYEQEVVPIVSAFSAGDINFWTTTYLYIGSHTFVDSEISVEAGLLVSWKTLDELADSKISPFAEYNKIVLAHYNQYTKE